MNLSSSGENGLASIMRDVNRIILLIGDHLSLNKYSIYEVQEHCPLI